MTSVHLVSAPTKWHKYLKLVEYGLIQLEDLERDIHRYKFRDREKLIRDLRRDLKVEEQQGRKNLYVVKLVPMRQRGVLQGQLPNFFMSGMVDVLALPDFLRENAGGSYEEVWYCRTLVDPGIFSVAGRIIFDGPLHGPRQTVEQVWHCSPRMLERFNGAFAWPYVRATRSDWGRRFMIEAVHIPLGCELTESKIAPDFWYAMGKIEGMRRPIESFCMLLDDYQFRVYSLEYKLVKDKVSIIDWDTPDDLKVLGG